MRVDEPVLTLDDHGVVEMTVKNQPVSSYSDRSGDQSLKRYLSIEYLFLSRSVVHSCPVSH